MPTGVVSIITNEDEDQVVAVAAESSETIPAASDAKEEVKAESEEAAGKEDYKAEDEIAARKEDYNDEETISDRLKVDDLELAPLSPLKVCMEQLNYSFYFIFCLFQRRKTASKQYQKYELRNYLFYTRQKVLELLKHIYKIESIQSFQIYIFCVQYSNHMNI